MPNSIDFRADQIQTKQIIVTGSGAGTNKLLIYGIEAQGSPVNEGVINTTYFPQTGIGGDVFLYVSGALNTKGSATVRGTSVFGGDLVVSGSLYNGLVTGSGGLYSHAEGLSTLASGAYSHAEGKNTYTFDRGSSFPTQRGSGSHAEGEEASATGNFSHAEGYQAAASGAWSHAEGKQTNAYGQYSHAEGYNCYAAQTYAHAEGYLTTGSGQASHAEGQNTTAQGAYSHAEGELTSTGGNYSHTEGYQTQTTGAYSHAQGSGSITWGIYSFAAGNRTIASGSVDVTQAAFGRFNKRNNETSLFVVGNGTGDSDALRGDIFRAESTGELVVSGAIRHAIKVVSSTATPTTNMTRSDYLVIVQTAGNAIVVLPEITDVVTDLGLTVEIRQMDIAISTRTVTIQPHATNSNYRIRGFDAETTTLVLGAAPAGTNTNRSVTLTFMGTGTGAFNKWVVIATSTC